MRLKILTIIFVVLYWTLMVSMHASAGEVKVEDKTLYFEGSIGKKEFGKFSQAFAHNEIDTVVLNSGGGYLSTAIFIGKYINNKDVTTVIAEGDECASACGLIFLAGKSTVLNGKLGIHCSYIKDEEGCYMPGVDKMESYLRDINLSENTVAFYIKNAQQRKMKWFTKKK